MTPPNKEQKPREYYVDPEFREYCDSLEQHEALHGKGAEYGVLVEYEEYAKLLEENRWLREMEELYLEGKKLDRDLIKELKAEVKDYYEKYRDAMEATELRAEITALKAENKRINKMLEESSNANNELRIAVLNDFVDKQEEADFAFVNLTARETELTALKARMAEAESNSKFTIGQYEFRNFHNGNYWITHESGEGMEVGKDKLEALITQFYADNF